MSPLLSKPRQGAAKDLLVVLAAIGFGVILVFPVGYAILTAFKTRAELSVYPPRLLPESFSNFENFNMVFQITPIMRFIGNSFIVSMMGSSLRIAFAILAAYAFTYFTFPGKTILFGIILASMMFPADTLVVTNYLTILRLNMLDNYFAMTVTALVGASQMFMLRQSMKTIPLSYRDAAFIDGCGDLRYLFHIVLPFTRPVILILLVQSFISFWNAYLWPLLVTNRLQMRTVQIGVAMLTNPLDTNFTLVLAAVTIILIPSFVIFIFLRMAVIRGIDSGALVN